MSSLEERLARLESVEEIRQVLMEYGRALDADDAEGYADLFADEAEWSGGGYSAKTPADIRAMVERLFAGRGPNNGSSHVLSNVIIEVEGVTASAWSRWMLVIPGPDGKPTIRVSGRYEDRLVRERGRWKILHRKLTHELQARPG